MSRAGHLRLLRTCAVLVLSLGLFATSTGCKAKPAAADQGGDVPPGYVVVHSTNAGRAFTVNKPKARSVRAALKSTLKDLAPFFDQGPSVEGAYEDKKNHRSGGATFTAVYRGRKVKGSLSCKLGKGGAFVAVVVSDANASAEDLAQLLDTPGQREGAGERESGEPSPPPRGDSSMKQYDFPDGSGSIGLAEGWHTNSQSCVSGVVLESSQGRGVALGLYYSVVTPDSTAVQMHRQMAAMSMQMGQRPPPLQLLVAPYSGPFDAVRNLAGQLSALSAANRGPAFVLDHLAPVGDAQPWSQGGRAGVLTYGVTEDNNGRRAHYKVRATVETLNMGQGAWLLSFREILRSPDDSFERDLPIMQAMAASWRVNDQVIARKTRENIDAANQRFAAGQRAHRDQVEAFDRKNRSWEQNQRTQARSHDDFSEAMRGYRTVEDTRTGERRSADLGNVDSIVDHLNQQDPGRYQQIPLRDELDPKGK